MNVERDLCGRKDDKGEELEEVGGEIQQGTVYTCIRLHC